MHSEFTVSADVAPARLLNMLACFAGSGTSALQVQLSSPRKLLDTCGTPSYGQCGGLSCSGTKQCEDAPSCCPIGQECVRQNAYYWQCTPNATATPFTTPGATSEVSRVPACTARICTATPHCLLTSLRGRRHLPRVQCNS